MQISHDGHRTVVIGGASPGAGIPPGYDVCSTTDPPDRAEDR